MELNLDSGALTRSLPAKPWPAHDFLFADAGGAHPVGLHMGNNNTCCPSEEIPPFCAGLGSGSVKTAAWAPRAGPQAVH